MLVEVKLVLSGLVVVIVFFLWVGRFVVCGVWSCVGYI